MIFCGSKRCVRGPELDAAIAQRLVRSLCNECRQERPLTLDEHKHFTSLDLNTPVAIYEPAGCSSCLQTGHSGRIPLIEIVEVDEALRERIRDNSVREESQHGPSRETLASHGLAPVAAGHTTLAEVTRAVELQ